MVLPKCDTYTSLGFPRAQSTIQVHLSMQKMRVRSLGQDDPLEGEMATHSSILVWRIPWTEEPGGLQSMGSQKVRQDLMTEHTHRYMSLS